MNKREKRIKKEQKDIQELLKIASLNELTDTGSDNIYTFAHLGGQRQKLIRMMVLETYLQIDTKMNILIANFFFHHCQDDCEEVQKITTSKEFIVFSEKILNEMPFLRKVSSIKSFIFVPKKIVTDLNKLNDLRNAMAHALIPENLGTERVTYKGKSIFTLEGVRSFNKDMKSILSFLQRYFIQAFKDNKKKLGSNHS
ncbi:MAG TPA: hypothetical protein P5056_00460 [Candidatus Paceibacterota bacterium]|nr:hypothetical protein [Candidatus Paceibacterota bacterium]